jgi:hypothetical protein
LSYSVLNGYLVDVVMKRTLPPFVLKYEMVSETTPDRSLRFSSDFSDGTFILFF